MDFRPLSEADRLAMLKRIGVPDTAALFADIPEEIRLDRRLDLPGPYSEPELLDHLTELADSNTCPNGRDLVSFLGAGCYQHYIPKALDAVLSRSEFYTAYTPYQAEITQGLLQAIYEYQSMVCQLTGMDVANASLYDGATACAEAAIMACNVHRRSKVALTETLHPEYRRVLRTYLEPQGIEVVIIPCPEGRLTVDELDQYARGAACLLVQHPNFYGLLEDVSACAEVAHQNEAAFISCINPISLGLLQSPGEYGADIVAADGQPLGNPPSFGGPGLGILAAKEKYLRRLPGRVVGATTDAAGRRAFVLTLQTREQHIRREKATSNICSNQALNALAAALYLSLLGPWGLRDVAEQCLQKAHYTCSALCQLPGVERAYTGPFFHEFALRLPNAEEVHRQLLQRGILAGIPLRRLEPSAPDALLLNVTEVHKKRDIDRLVEGMGELL